VKPSWGHQCLPFSFECWKGFRTYSIALEHDQDHKMMSECKNIDQNFTIKNLGNGPREGQVSSVTINAEQSTLLPPWGHKTKNLYFWSVLV
jgi:hypothetical protein